MLNMFTKSTICNCVEKILGLTRVTWSHSAGEMTHWWISRIVLSVWLVTLCVSETWLADHIVTRQICLGVLKRQETRICWRLKYTYRDRCESSTRDTQLYNSSRGRPQASGRILIMTYKPATFAYCLDDDSSRPSQQGFSFQYTFPMDFMPAW